MPIRRSPPPDRVTFRAAAATHGHAFPLRLKGSEHWKMPSPQNCAKPSWIWPLVLIFVPFPALWRTSSCGKDCSKSRFHVRNDLACHLRRPCAWRGLILESRELHPSGVGGKTMTTRLRYFLINRETWRPIAGAEKCTYRMKVCAAVICSFLPNGWPYTLKPSRSQTPASSGFRPNGATFCC